MRTLILYLPQRAGATRGKALAWRSSHGHAPEVTGSDALQDRLRTLILKSGLALGGLSETDRALALAVPARALARGAVASEAQVNALLKSSLGAESSFLGTDHVELRRWLVDTRWWQRDAFGRRYERVPEAELPEVLRAIDAALGDGDVASWVTGQREAARTARDQRRHAWAQRQPRGPQDPDT